MKYKTIVLPILVATPFLSCAKETINENVGVIKNPPVVFSHINEPQPDDYGRACFFVDKAYQGHSVCFTIEDDQSIIEVPETDVYGLKDNITSISLHGPVNVAFYRDADYQGENYSTLADVYELKKNNNAISSIRIEAAETIIVDDPQDGPKRVQAPFTCLYQDAGYIGTPVCLSLSELSETASILDLGPLHLNNELSSVMVVNTYFGSNLAVTLHDRTNLGGSHHTTTASILNLHDVGFNDKTSSFQITQQANLQP